MKNLIINKLYIFSPSDKKAKMVNFTRGINIVTSSKQDGNKKGKSIILKSIFHTLGADSYFDDKWSDSTKVYVLNFSYNSLTYTICRHNKLFKLFDSEQQLVFETIDRKQLAEKLNKIFNFSVRLPNRHDDRIEITSPVYNYILNYIDQDKMDCTRFNSFKSLTEYAGYKANTLYYHFGVFDERYYELIKLIEQSEDEHKKTLNEKNAINNVIERISVNIGDIIPPIDLNVLQKELNINTNAYQAIVEKMRTVRKKLIKFRNEYSDINTMLNELKLVDASIISEIEKLNQHKCPYCSAYIENSTEMRILKYNDAEDVEMLSLDLQAQLLEIQNKIKKIEDEYVEYSKKLKEYEDKIDAETRGASDIIRARNMRDLLDKFRIEYGNISNYLDDIENKIAELKKEKRKYDQKKKQVNKRYSELMQSDRVSFGLQEIDTSRFANIELSFEAGGSNKPIATVIWYFNLLRLKNEFNPTCVKFPLVLDSPNNVELDDGKRRELFDYLFNNVDENTQLIISTLGFSTTDYLGAQINNVINLDNPKYSLLNEHDYNNHINVLKMCNKSNIVD